MAQTTQQRLLTEIEEHILTLNPVQALEFGRQIAEKFKTALSNHAVNTVHGTLSNSAAKAVDGLIEHLRKNI